MELIIFTGNVGCGKSFLASKFAKRGYTIVCIDTLIESISGTFDKHKMEVYHATEDAIIEKSLYEGFSVVVDRTNMDKKTRKRFIDIGKKMEKALHHGVKIISYDWGIGKEVDLERRIKSSKECWETEEVWANVFDYMSEHYEKPSFDEGFDEILSTPEKYTFFAFDFDGTIVEKDFPKIGAIKEKEVLYMDEIWKEISNVIIIWTCRSGDYLDQMRVFLLENNIPFDFINENPLFDTGSRKVFAHKYIDDRSKS